MSAAYRIIACCFHPAALRPGDGSPLLHARDALTILAEVEAERDGLRKRVEWLREALGYIGEDDELAEVNGAAFGLYAYRTKRDQARAALMLSEKGGA